MWDVGVLDEIQHLLLVHVVVGLLKVRFRRKFRRIPIPFCFSFIYYHWFSIITELYVLSSTLVIEVIPRLHMNVIFWIFEIFLLIQSCYKRVQLLSNTIRWEISWVMMDTRNRKLVGIDMDKFWKKYFNYRKIQLKSYLFSRNNSGKKKSGKASRSGSISSAAAIM